MKKLIVQLFNKFGLDVRKLSYKNESPLVHIKRFVQNDKPLILDVGANAGQTIKRFKGIFPNAVIHSFEPVADTFTKLTNSISGKYEHVSLYNYALGATVSEMKFLENTRSDMSSFLPLGNDGWGQIVKESSIHVSTIDQFCKENNIDKIDCLKSDTQGFELEVFKGAQKSIAENKIGLIYFEIIFCDMYKNLPSFSDIYDFLTKNNFLLVSFYDPHFRNQLVGWTDALFIHKSYLTKE